jgi:antitoxin VapB
MVMNAPRKSRTFKSGNSVALRLPKVLGIPAGVEMTIREERGRYVIEPVAAEPRKIDLTGIAGSMPWLKPLSPEDREFEDEDRPWHLFGGKSTR